MLVSLNRYKEERKILKITKDLIKYNFSKGNKPQYLVIHDTGNKKKGANARAHYKYFNGADRGASAHFFVDDKEIIQVVKESDASWHCGDGRGKYGISNFNSLGIEICINEDSDYKETLENTLALVRTLQAKHGIQDERVVRHFDASKKICPRSMSAHNWKIWEEFKRRLAKLELEERELQQAIKILKELAIINSPEYWLKNARKGKKIKGEYAASVLKRVIALCYQ